MSARTLVGIGVGPGDPELVTLKAVAALASCDAVLVPHTSDGDSPGRAETIVTAACPQATSHLIRVPFVMGERRGVTPRRAQAWEASASAAVAAFEAGASQVGFATIGDPSVYSTFSYLAGTVRELLPDVTVEVIPGITAMQALAAASATPLVEGDEILALVPLKGGLGRLADVAELVDTCVVYKAGRHLDELRDLVALSGADAVAGVDVGLPGETLLPLADMESGSYFTTVLWTPRRERIGGRL